MTEEEWLDCTDPGLMLEFLRGKGSARKLRLFGLACCRRMWHLLPNEHWKELVESGEEFANGAVSREALNRAWWRVPVPSPGPSADFLTVAADTIGCVDFTPEKAQIVAFAAAKAIARATDDSINVEAYRCRPRDIERGVQSHLLRDLFGNPFRRVSLDPAWITPTTLSAVRVINDERRFEDLPILADALEDAGCTDADILSHCRGPGPHVRGCWVVDLLLGKQ